MNGQQKEHFAQYKNAVPPQQQANPTKGPKYPVQNPKTQPGIGEAFQAGYQYGGFGQKDRLTADEWYDLNYIHKYDWLKKYPNRNPRDYEYWSHLARERQQRLRQPNWLERVLVPQTLRNKVPGFIRAII